MDTSRICNSVKNVYKPDKQYSFPKTNGRSFRYDWLNYIPGFVIYPVKMVDSVCHAYFLGIVFLVKLRKTLGYLCVLSIDWDDMKL